MKKMLKIAGLALAFGALLVSCASNGGAKKGDAPASIHPRAYHIDLADAEDGATVALAYNQYGPNYQTSPNLQFGKYIKLDKPKAGDTVYVHYKFTSDTDLPVIALGLVDDSAAASYWRNLLDPSVVELAKDIKAGETIEGNLEFVLAADVASKFGVYLQYDSEDTVKWGYAKVNAASVLTFEKCGETTDVSKELPSELSAPKGPQTHNVAVDKVAAFFQLEANHPWIDGVQDMSQTVGYQGIVHFGQMFEVDNLPQAGDTLHVTWKAKSDTDISKMSIRVVENSGAVSGWWAEIDELPGSGRTFVENVKAGEAFETSVDINLAQGAIEDISLVIWSELDECSQPATILMVRD